jgi:hypothetical protein
MTQWTARGREPSGKQADWLDAIFDQLKEREERHCHRHRQYESQEEAAK